MSRQVESVSLHAALADIEEQSRRVEQPERTAGEILLLRKYYEHERTKLLVQIALLGLQSRIEELEVAYKFSQTPGAQANYRRRINLIHAGRAMGRSRETYLPPLPQVSAKAALDGAIAERSAKAHELQELCNRDAEWDRLLPKKKDAGDQPDRQSHPAAQSRRRNALSDFHELAGRLMTEARALRCCRQM